MATIQECGLQLLQHLPCSPDLAPSEYYIFNQMKMELSGRHFGSDDDFIAAVCYFLEVLNSSFYQ